MTRRTIRCAKAALGVLLVPVFAVALLFSLGTTFILARDVLAARGDWGAFEAQMRHYSDRLDVAADGSLVLHRAPFPVASFVATLVVGWFVALVAGYLLERIRRDVWSSAPCGSHSTAPRANNPQ